MQQQVNTTHEIQASLGLRGYPPASCESISGKHRGPPRRDARAVRFSQRAIASTLKSISIMGTFKATAYQAFTTTRDNDIVDINQEFTFSVNLDNNNKAERNKVVGTFINRLFRYLQLQQDTGARFANLSHPLLMRFNVGKTTIDLGSIDETLQARLKVGHAAKSKRAFALRVKAIVEFLLETPEVVDIDDVIAGLEDVIAGEAVAELVA